MAIQCDNADNLSIKAELLADYLERYFIDTNGLVYSAINVKTHRPWTDADCRPGDEYIKVAVYTQAEIQNYEDAGMTTGSYLAALAYQHQVTGDARVLARARRTFEGIASIYEMGGRQERGYFPKTYGGRCSEETSTDQYLYAMKGMMAYWPLAATDHRDKIREMMPAMVDYWVRRAYRRDYFEFKNMLWPLGRFPSLLIMAYVISEQKKYLDEFYRLNEEFQVYRQPVESQIAPHVAHPEARSAYEKRVGKYLLSYLSSCAAMDIMELDECLLHSDAYKTYWLASMQQMWREGILEITERGLSYVSILYDPRSGAVTPPAPGWIHETPPQSSDSWSFSFWTGTLLRGCSTMLARVGNHVAHWLPEENAGDVVRRILTEISPQDMRNYIDPDGRQMLAQHRFLGDEVSGIAITNWLWAYWQGREQGTIAADC